MGQDKKYVLYEKERDNQFINSFNMLDEEVQKLIVNKDGSYKIVPFLSLAKYKNARTIADLSSMLDENEHLVIEVKDADISRVAETSVITYNPSQSKELTGKYYVVNYDFELNGLDPKTRSAFEPCVLLKMDDGTYTLKVVVNIADNIRERRAELAHTFGGYSDLCYKITDLEVVERFQEDCIELTRDEDGLKITKIPESLLKSK